MGTLAQGKRGEDIAARYLEQRGMRVIARNFRTREGEIDLICRDGRETVFVEVKYRTSSLFGAPEEAVTWTKLSRLKRAISAYLAKHPARRYRLDVVAIEELEDRSNVRWLRSVG